MSELIVSVPYRGATFLNSRKGVREMEKDIVSVPYRGATFLNKKKLSEQRKELACFRPLSGSYISQ